MGCGRLCISASYRAVPGSSAADFSSHPLGYAVLPMGTLLPRSSRICRHQRQTDPDPFLFFLPGPNGGESSFYLPPYTSSNNWFISRAALLSCFHSTTDRPSRADLRKAIRSRSIDSTRARCRKSSAVKKSRVSRSS